MTKYNDKGKGLTIFDTVGSNKRDGDDTSRSQHRKKSRADRDEERLASILPDSARNARGLDVSTRLQVIELSQLEDAKKMDDIKSLQSHWNGLYHNLLTERAQAIQLASTICPTYDPNNEFWMEVKDLTKQIGTLKKEISELVQQGDEEIARKINLRHWQVVYLQV